MIVPDGFERHFRTSRVTEPWEPIYSREDPDAIVLGLHLAEAHCNSRGFAHGGVIATLSDNAMGLSLVHLVRKSLGVEAALIKGALTVNLAVDYVTVAEPGQWLQIGSRVIRFGRSLGFVEALVTTDGEPMARANATFSLVKAKIAQALPGPDAK
jgi:acyl-coenzyme A thioesterase PaaI-like protein